MKYVAHRPDIHLFSEAIASHTETGIEGPVIRQMRTNENQQQARERDRTVRHITLSPDTGRPLIDGRVEELLVTLVIARDVEPDRTWEMSAQIDDGDRAYFRVTSIGTLISAEFSVSLKWDVAISGAPLRVKLVLYHRKNANGRAALRVRVASLTRNYKVICDPDEFFLLRFLRRIFGLCRC